MNVTSQYSYNGPKREAVLHVCFVIKGYTYAVLELLEHAGGADAVCEPAYYPVATARTVLFSEFPDFVINDNPYKCLGNENGGSGYSELEPAKQRLEKLRENGAFL